MARETQEGVPLRMGRVGTSSGKKPEKGGFPEGPAPELSILGGEARASCRARTPSAEESAGTKAQE